MGVPGFLLPLRVSFFLISTKVCYVVVLITLFVQFGLYIFIIFSVSEVILIHLILPCLFCNMSNNNQLINLISAATILDLCLALIVQRTEP